MADCNVKTVVETMDTNAQTAEFFLNGRAATLVLAGTWDSASLAIKGSHDAATWVTLHPAITANGGYEILSPWPWIQVVATVSGTTDIDVTVAYLNHGA